MKAVGGVARDQPPHLVKDVHARQSTIPDSGDITAPERHPACEIDRIVQGGGRIGFTPRRAGLVG
ncbi:hypothetical protein [Microbispora rosea]|uniref:hypothetical protein n=1 Tax=Microbispora rosea TaxID=58117 RepID=UPI003429BB21